MSTDRLHRVTDLFNEGEILHLGDDEQGPVTVWVNKLNPFQAQEAQKDAQARRFLAIAKLKDSGEYDGMVAEAEMLPPAKLASEYVEMCGSEIYLDALNDLDIDELAREERENLERTTELLDDAGVSEDAPERDVAERMQRTWIGRLSDLQKQKAAEKLREAEAMPIEDLREKYLELWRDWTTRAVFEQQHRMTQVYFALRECSAARAGEKWDHKPCDHSKRYLDDRSQVPELPSQMLDLVIETLDQMTVPARAAGNSDAPTSSSDSLEPSSAPEEVSKPSSPDEMLSDSPTT